MERVPRSPAAMCPIAVLSIWDYSTTNGGRKRPIPALSSDHKHVPPLSVLRARNPSPCPWAALVAEAGELFSNPVPLLFLGYRRRLYAPISPAVVVLT